MMNRSHRFHEKFAQQNLRRIAGLAFHALSADAT
jgi:hypothetical protein